MYPFNYSKVGSVAEALEAVAAKSDAKLLAGGQTLIASLKLRLANPSDLIDLGNVAELRGITVEGDQLVIGAMTRHAEVAASQTVREMIPALADMAGMIGDRMVRNMGTMGGSIANSDPAADYPAAVVALGATVRTDKRSIAADDFFTGLFETALAAGEIITAVAYPKPMRAAYMKFRNPASRYALVGVFVAETPSGVRVAVTGAGPSVFRVPEMERALAENFKPEAVADIKISPDGLNSDLHASNEYRAHIVTVMTKRAVEKANR